MQAILGWLLVGVIGGVGAFSLLPLLVKGSLQWPALAGVLLVVFGGTGAAILAVGLFRTAKHVRLAAAGPKTEGRVVDQRTDHETIRHNSNSRMADDTSVGSTTSTSWVHYYPVVEFRTDRGQAVRVEGSVEGTGKPWIETGTPVTVYFHPADPSNAVLGTFSELWLRPLVLVAAGAIFLAFGLVGYRSCAKARAADLDAALSPEAVEQRMQRDLQASDQYPVHLQGTIVRTERAEIRGPAQYRFICSAVRPGAAAPEEFPSEAVPVDPGGAFTGKPVDLYLDRKDPKVYYVPLGPLIRELAARPR